MRLTSSKLCFSLRCSGKLYYFRGILINFHIVNIQTQQFPCSIYRVNTTVICIDDEPSARKRKNGRKWPKKGAFTQGIAIMRHWQTSRQIIKTQCKHVCTSSKSRTICFSRVFNLLRRSRLVNRRYITFYRLLELQLAACTYLYLKTFATIH